ASSGQIAREALGLGDGPVLLLYTRFVEFRPDRPIRVLKRVVSAVPTARLLVVGQGLHGEEAHLLQAAQAEGVQDHVIYADWLTGQALAHACAAADLALYP
ncbi:MAG: glycosyltransferase WbuB, partial [Chloroflexota bacterium]